MAEIHDFEKLQLKKIAKKTNPARRLEIEILITVIKYVYAFTEEVYDDPVEHIKPSCSTRELFNGDRNRFANSFVELMKYWEIFLNPENIPLNEEFERFPTIESLCLFVEEEIKNKK